MNDIVMNIVYSIVNIVWYVGSYVPMGEQT